eukprot:SAG22_NODE_875_length_6716_cov_2.927006_3_plen_379_part_00
MLPPSPLPTPNHQVLTEADRAQQAAEAEKARARVARMKDSRARRQKRRHRHCWWIPTQHTRVEYDNLRDQRAEIVRRQVLMLRRSTLQWYFSAAQAGKLIEVIPKGRLQRGQVEALVVLFARVTDFENLRCDKLLNFKGYDRDGNHYVSAIELEKLASDPFVHLSHRLGSTNLFNPLRPEREYALNLRHADDRVTAQLLVVLTAEPGENIIYESYNEMPFDVGKAWETNVPTTGIFCCEFVTPPDCGSLALRIPLAQRMLLPGKVSAFPCGPTAKGTVFLCCSLPFVVVPLTGQGPVEVDPGRGADGRRGPRGVRPAGGRRPARLLRGLGGRRGRLAGRAGRAGGAAPGLRGQPGQVVRSSVRAVEPQGKAEKQKERQ